MPLDTLLTAVPRVAILGGGITGLAAAHRLTELLPRAEIHLLEAAPRLGGVLDTVHIDGFLIERSADNFLTKLPHALDLCRRLGIGDELIPTDRSRRRAFVVRDGQLLPIPEGFYLMVPRRLWPTLASPILSLSGKLRLLAEVLVPALKPPVLSPPSPLPDESVASFVRRRFGREVFERLVQPLVAGIYTADPEKLSMAATMPDFLALERKHGRLLTTHRNWLGHQSAASSPRTGHFSDQSTDTATGARYDLFVAPQQGMASLVAAFANRLPSVNIHLNTRVTTVEKKEDSRWQLGLREVSDLGCPVSDVLTPETRHPTLFDAVIVALPAHSAASVFRSFDARLAAELAAIEYAGCAIVSLGFARDQITHSLDGFGVVVPQTENRRIIAASFASQKFPGRAPDNTVLIRTFIGGAVQPELLDLSDADLCQLALAELRTLLKITGEPIVADIARWPRSMPQYHVGHCECVARIEQLTAVHPTLALAGNAYHGVGIPQCIASGEAAAEWIAKAWTQ